MNKQDKIFEICDDLEYSNISSIGLVDFETKGAYPFKYDNSIFEFEIGYESDTHSNIDDNLKHGFQGRIYTVQKVLTFWSFPDANKLDIFLKNLKNTLKKQRGVNVDFSNGWYIELDLDGSDSDGSGDDFSADKFNNTFGYGSSDLIPSDNDSNIALVKLQNYKGSNNPSENDYKLHLLRVAQKERLRKQGKLDVPDNSSSKKKFDDMEESQPMAKYRNRKFQEKKILDFKHFIKKLL